ncbi:hypothetical protein M8818_001392 [Zalaria obscura]|uniref:Uncharacterized protein n=1 Tax=Zalaria obscura TaxID=2024903 RepID=A0ACC3SP68_9PEZI
MPLVPARLRLLTRGIVGADASELPGVPMPRLCSVHQELCKFHTLALLPMPKPPTACPCHPARDCGLAPSRTGTVHVHADANSTTTARITYTPHCLLCLLAIRALASCSDARLVFARGLAGDSEPAVSPSPDPTPVP